MKNISKTDLSHFTSILPFHLSKPSVISYTENFKGIHGNSNSPVELIKDIVPEIGYIAII